MHEILQTLIQSNTINFLIVVGLIIFVFYKIEINKKLQNTADKIKDYVQAAENDREIARKKLEMINGKIQKLPEVVQRIKRSTENSVKNYEKKIQNDIEEEKTVISKNSQRHFDFETRKFKNKLSNLLSEKSIEIAYENAKAQLKDNRELHNIYIDSAIEELDRITL